MLIRATNVAIMIKIATEFEYRQVHFNIYYT